ncbi:sister chromatid cohesion protein PDS5 homolog D-like isoform X2 [Andrographis paniculata]|uniref:sister chromatid cohesion protein PDS5 homolog D-like isoform X2 n=1 Tax=Andrographis paniculata TaxID=175694 RepID=UPI0021E74802|nr:sister chromatid cohesion protein PDS5 homolog D-like isoform X2 [Andrographis paniculata]
MGLFGVDDSSQTSIEAELESIGKNLREPAAPLSTNELLVLLEKAECLLSQVWQRPPMSTRDSLLPLMQALMGDEILQHTDICIQIVVACCFNELSRISAPDAPFPDEKMRVFFRLFMVVFQQLPNRSEEDSNRALKIIETMAKVRSGLMLLDIDKEGLVVEMIRIFLSNIRPHHPHDMFKYMEMIMSMVINESDDISFELLKPLLDSVKRDNEVTSIISFELGKKIFKNCRIKVQPFLKEAIKGMNLDPGNYADIIASLVSDPADAENMVAEVADAVPQAADDNELKLDLVPKTENEDDTRASAEDGTEVVGDISQETLEGSQQPVKSGIDLGGPRRRRGRKPNTKIRPEEGYQHPWSLGGKNSTEANSNSYNQIKKDLASPSEIVDKNVQGECSKKSDSAKVVRHGKRGRPRKKENIINELNDQEKPKEKQMEPEKIKSTKKQKDKKSKTPRGLYGEKLINQRIQVWWPMDETYYTGTVTAFDPETKMHTILYDDDETEILKLKKEKWALFSDEHLHQREEVIHPSPAVEPTETAEKSSKVKAGRSKKQIASSSKKSKGENTSLVAGGNSESDGQNVKTPEKIVSQKDVEGTPAGKDNSKH